MHAICKIEETSSPSYSVDYFKMWAGVSGNSEKLCKKSYKNNGHRFLYIKISVILNFEKLLHFWFDLPLHF